MAVNTIISKEFDDIGRGTSLTIPVLIHRLDNTPFDLTGYQIFFTMKEVQWDYDYDDIRACVHKEVYINSPEEGKFFIQLSSQDTWHTPGAFFFDVELVRNGAVARPFLFRFNLIGGPTNRSVNPSEAQLVMAPAISVTMTDAAPITIITPLISDPPTNLIETIIAEPPYLIEALDDPQAPIRNIKIKSYAPQVSFVMIFNDLHDALPHYYNFEEYSFPNLPEDCPLHNGRIRIKDREIIFELSEEMEMDVFDSFIQYSPDMTFNGKHTHQLASFPYYVGDNVAHGTFNVTLYTSKQRQIHITGNYTMPDMLNIPSRWMLRIDYFNWN